MGYGDVGAESIPEKCLAIVAMFAGVIFFSLMVGSLTSLLSDLDKKNSIYEDKIKILDTIVRQYSVTDAKLLAKIHLLVKSRIYAQDNSYSELMDVLPKKLAVSLSEIIYKPIVENIKFFQEIDPEILLTVAPELHLCRFMTGEHIMNKGEYPNEVYFIKSGSIGLTIPDYGQEVFMNMNQGSYFGETEIIYNTHRKFTAIAVTPVEVLTLERKHFIRIFFKEFKEHGRALKQHAEQRMAKQIKTYDAFRQVVQSHYDRKKSVRGGYSHKQNREMLEKDYLGFLSQDTLAEVEPKFSPSFMERNKGMLPAIMGKREAEDILLENNDRLPKIVKEIDSKFSRVEELLQRAMKVVNTGKNQTNVVSGLKSPRSPIIKNSQLWNY